MKLVISDAHEGLKAARKAVMPSVPWQRCQFHLQQNATAYVPKQSMRKEVAQDIRSVFNEADPQEAKRRLGLASAKWRETAPKLAEWMEAAIPEGLTVLQIPVAHRRRMRTVNMIERLNRELKRRTRVATLFPNEPSLLRLVSAVLVEVCEEWETGRKYLNMEQE